MALERELKHFESIRAELLNKGHEGKFALIKGEELVGTFDRPGDAYSEGVKRFGQEFFLIKQILRDNRTEHVPAISIGVLNAHL